MKILKFQTNVKCGGCVATITPFLNQEKGIANWNVDLANPQRILAVETEELTSGEIIEVMKKAGYQASPIEG
jgi:copper chaperone